MIFLMTKDSFLLQGFWQLKDNHEMIKINSLSEIDLRALADALTVTYTLVPDAVLQGSPAIQ